MDRNSTFVEIPDAANGKIPKDLVGVGKGCRVVMIDNYDSFTWNLYQYVCLLGAQVDVYRGEEVTVEQLAALPGVTHILISPGPGHPATDSGISMPAILEFAGKVPILGICMGLQCMVTVFGGIIEPAGEIVHGKGSPIAHDGKHFFSGVRQDAMCTRYHSLAARPISIPDELEVTCTTDSGVIMGVRHKTYAFEGVQYHPEGILSEDGLVYLANFLRQKDPLWKHADSATSAPSEASKAASSRADAPKESILTKINTRCVEDSLQRSVLPGHRPKDVLSILKLGLAPPPLSFYNRIVSTPHTALFGEIKRASPSKGLFEAADTPSAPEIALDYARSGASAISVLTEPHWFKGSLQDLHAVRTAVSSLANRPAILRKDFVTNTYQIEEARVNGADTVLLIVAIIPEEAKLRYLIEYSRAHGMDPLVEINSSLELTTALAAGAEIIGVNNRNLHDFSVDLNTTSKIASVIDAHADLRPAGLRPVILCALSGISTRQDVVTYESQGVKAVLVGESLMKAADRPAHVKLLLGIQDSPVSSAQLPPLVKVCGIKTLDAALVVSDAGADFIGFIFVQKSPRYVSFDSAKSIIDSVSAKATPKPLSSIPEARSFFDFQIAAFRAKRAALGRPLFVGVFQNAPLSDILSAVAQLGLDAVQLHGNEDPEWAQWIPVPVFKVFHVSAGSAGSSTSYPPTLDYAAQTGSHALPLLDAKISTSAHALSGGAGRLADMDLVASWAAAHPGVRFGLGGGISPENVASVVASMHPSLVDASSALEENGAKSHDKIRNYISAAKNV